MSDLHLTQLGREVRGYSSPDEAVIERVPNPQAGQLFVARFTVYEVWIFSGRSRIRAGVIEQITRVNALTATHV